MYAILDYVLSPRIVKEHALRFMKEPFVPKATDWACLKNIQLFSVICFALLKGTQAAPLVIAQCSDSIPLPSTVERF